MPVAIIKATARLVSSDPTQLVGPSSVAIAAALRSARLAGNEATRGNWIGPAPRVTRTGAFGEQTVNVAWAYGWPSEGPWSTTAPLHALVAELVDGVATRLNAMPGAPQWNVTAPAYDTTMHGLPQWWASGEAANTVTKDAPVSTTTESPWGPMAITLPPTVRTPPSPAAGWSTGAKVGVVGLGAGAIALVWYGNKKKWW